MLRSQASTARSRPSLLCRSKSSSKLLSLQAPSRTRTGLEFKREALALRRISKAMISSRSKPTCPLSSLAILSTLSKRRRPRSWPPLLSAHSQLTTSIHPQSLRSPFRPQHRPGPASISTRGPMVKSITTYCQIHRLLSMVAISVASTWTPRSGTRQASTSLLVAKTMGSSPIAL